MVEHEDLKINKPHLAVPPEKIDTQTGLRIKDVNAEITDAYRREFNKQVLMRRFNADEDFKRVEEK